MRNWRSSDPRRLSGGEVSSSLSESSMTWLAVSSSDDTLIVAVRLLEAVAGAEAAAVAVAVEGGGAIGM